MAEERTRLGELTGQWAGTNRLWLTPEEPARESETTATVARVARDRFATIRYRWSEAGAPQDGLLLVRLATSPADVEIVWLDSFHTSGEFMLLRAEEEKAERAIVSARGSYAAPPGPDWGWRIAIRSEAPSELRIVMHNITPDGQEALAVEAKYAR